MVSVEIGGHAGYADSGKDVVCAAVTSCVEMAANTLTEVLRCPARVEVGADCVRVALGSGCEAPARQVLEGLYLHLRALAKQVPGHVTVRKKPIGPDRTGCLSGG